jgi:23S rRNA pseudouridine1911/1915/1917 synthase
MPPVAEEAPLLAWLLKTLTPMNRTRVKQMLKHGGVAVNGRPVTRHDHPLKPGDTVTLLRNGAADRTLEEADITVVYRDDALIAIDKPAGLLTVATETERIDTAFARLSTHLEARKLGRPFVVHRLDRDTSGLLLFARSHEARDTLQAQWERTTKFYLAVVKGELPAAEGVIENHLVEGNDYRVRVCAAGELGAKRAISRYRVVKTGQRRSLVEIELVTGRKHQIRVHLNDLGFPILGDPVYGQPMNPANRLALHAARIVVPHPVAGEMIQLQAPLPDELRKLV